MPRKYHERFGIELGVAEAKRRFVNRVLNFILDHIRDVAWNIDEYAAQAELDKYLCSKLGERYTGRGCLDTVLGTDFDTCLRALEALSAHSDWNMEAERGIKTILAETEIDIGIRWENGHFLPSGAPALDAALVSDPLALLVTPEHKGVADAFKKGLDHFLHSIQKPALLADVLTDMYEALEALVKIVCGNDKGINANRDAFISKLGLHASYGKMLAEYIDYANLMARHAGEKGQAKPLPSRKEVEAFMYLTGLFIRLALSRTT